MFTVNIAQDVKVCVLPDVSLMTTYVLLEQEDWFEDEMDFIRRLIRPGMNCLDIGANHGVYSLTMAKLLQGDGKVLAFEPARAPGDMLKQSIAVNELGGVLTLVRTGMSIHSGEAQLCINTNSELNTLHGDGPKELIQLLTLDSLLESDLLQSGKVIDFIKLDAEGEEINVLKGGRKFFAQHSPLVMFEIKHGNEINHGLVQTFKNLGMSIYRLVPGLCALVPFGDEKQMDAYQLNLFACRGDQTVALQERGLLVANPSTSPMRAMTKWQDVLNTRPYTQSLIKRWKTLSVRCDNPFQHQYESALNTYISATDQTRPVAERFSLLCKSRDLFANLRVNGDTHISTILALIRVHADLGERFTAVHLTNQLHLAMRKGMTITLDRPFVPPIHTFDHRPVVGDLGQWLQAAILEALEKRRTFSSYFQTDLSTLLMVAKNPNHSIEFDRRLALSAIRQGKIVNITSTSRLLNETSSEHLNAVIWKKFANDRQVDFFLPFHYVFCSGMQRSGSTWSYNVARLLLCDHFGYQQIIAGYVGEGASVDTAVSEHQGTSKVLLLKFHQATDQTLSLATQGKAKVIYTHRSPMNALASLTDFFQIPFEQAVPIIEQAIKAMRAWISTNNALLVSFDALVSNPVREIERIAIFLNLPHDVKLIKHIANQTSYEKMKQAAEGLINDQSKLVKAGNSAYDPVTLLHVGHSPKGKSRDWRSQFTKEQQKYALEHLQQWVDENGDLKPNAFKS